MRQDVSMTIRWIKDSLKGNGKTQKDLAEHLGVAPSAVSRLLNGKRELKTREADTIADYIDQILKERADENAGLAAQIVRLTGARLGDLGLIRADDARLGTLVSSRLPRPRSVRASPGIGGHAVADDAEEHGERDDQRDRAAVLDLVLCQYSAATSCSLAMVRTQ